MAIPNQLWTPAPVDVEVSENEIHLWKVALLSDSRESNDSLLSRPLSDEEIARARRFHLDRDRNRFASARRALRRILAPYLRLRPEEIQFTAAEIGKPYVAAAQNSCGLQFNLSHSANLAIIGITLGRRIGVDVERFRDLDYLEIAKRYFSAREYRELSTLPSEHIRKNFFACWTRKEALLKALGEGIGSLLKQVTVSVGQFEAPKVVESEGIGDAIRSWKLEDVAVDPDYAAAIAFENAPVEIRFWVFNE
jgi:4'-phosphopantetheinyl transferase